MNRNLCFLLIGLILAFKFKFTVPLDKIAVLYQLLGIMFSIGITLLVSVNLSGVKNTNYVHEIRDNINTVRNRFIIYFVISTISYMLADISIKNYNLCVNFTKNYNLCVNFNLNCNLVSFYLNILSLTYFIINFTEVQKLNESIFDKINKE
jgi:hypothetical protein